MRLQWLAAYLLTLLPNPLLLANPTNSPLIINDPSWPPFFYAGDPESPPGFAKEVLTHCLNKMDIAFVFKFHPIKRMRVSMEKGLIDINMYSYKPSRESFLEFGKEKIFNSTYIPFVKAGRDIKISAISDFDGLRLGHQIGLRYSKDFYHYVLQRKKLRKLDEAPNMASNIRKLIHDRIDVFVGSQASARYWINSLQFEGKIKSLDYIVKSSDYFLTLSKKSPRVGDKQDFLRQTSTCFAQTKRDGTYCDIAKKYQVSCPKVAQ